MPLLESMPVVWCVLIWIVFLNCLIKNTVSIGLFTVSTGAFLLSLCGVQPWIQVFTFAVCLPFAILFKRRSFFGRHSSNKTPTAIVLQRSGDCTNGTVLFRGQHISAYSGCSFEQLPPCGSTVYILAFDQNTAIVCCDCSNKS